MKERMARHWLTYWGGDWPDVKENPVPEDLPWDRVVALLDRFHPGWSDLLDYSPENDDVGEGITHANNREELPLEMFWALDIDYDTALSLIEREEIWFLPKHGPCSLFEFVEILGEEDISFDWTRKSLQKAQKTLRHRLREGLPEGPRHVGVESPFPGFHVLHTEEDYKAAEAVHKNCVWWHYWYEPDSVVHWNPTKKILVAFHEKGDFEEAERVDPWAPEGKMAGAAEAFFQWVYGEEEGSARYRAWTTGRGSGKGLRGWSGTMSFVF